VAHDRRNSTRILPEGKADNTLQDRPTTDTNVESTKSRLGGAGLELFGPASLERAGIRVESAPTCSRGTAPLGARPPHAAEHRHGVRLA